MVELDVFPLPNDDPPNAVPPDEAPPKDEPPNEDCPKEEPPKDELPEFDELGEAPNPEADIPGAPGTWVFKLPMSWPLGPT